MKVWDLECPTGHRFEGWFASEDDWRRQQERGLLTCPMCGSAQVHRCLSAPRLNLGERASVPVERTPDHSTTPSSGPVALQQAWWAAVREVMAQTEDVGQRFAEEARRIHYGESPERAIRGQASADERHALNEEGIEVLPLPLPPGMNGPVQ